MKPGRNDPCLCGSGKKYKHCCLAAEQRRAETPEYVAWMRLRRAIGQFPSLLANFVVEVYPPYALDAAWESFTVYDNSAFDPDSALAPLFMPWFYYAWRPERFEEEEQYEFDEALEERAPTSLFLERQGRQLQPLTQRYLEACLAAPYTFHEILRCDPGRGFRARDVLSGEEHEVLENLATESMQAGDIFFAQLVPIDGIVVVEACAPYPLPPEDKIPIIELREKMRSAPPADQDWPSRMQDWDHEIRGLFFDLIDRYLEQELPELHNTDGDLIAPQRVVFDVDDAERALEALTREPGTSALSVERDAGGRLERARLSWTKTAKYAGMENTMLADVEVTPGCIVGHMNSDERAEAFCDMVEEALGSEARFRDRDVVDQEQLEAELDAEIEAELAEMDDESLEEEIAAVLDGFDRQRDDPSFEDVPNGESLADDPELREHASRFFEKYYDEWVTQELPVLGGKRPIDVVNEPHGREKVEALVIGIERTAAHVNPEAGASVVARLRERLGLAPR